jgi:hypothetical protein
LKRAVGGSILRPCLVVLAALPCCRASSSPPDAGPAPPAAVTAPLSGTADAAAPSRGAGEGAATVSTPPPAPRAPPAEPVADGGAGAGAGCRLRRGPLRLSMKGPALFWSADPAARTDFRVIFNRDGVATREAPAFAELSGARPQPGKGSGDGGVDDSGEPPRASWPACSEADRFVFCMDLGGSIKRTALSGEAESIVAAGRRGSTLAAVALPGGHTLLVFLADRKTTEGVVTQAFATLDDRPALPLSAEGSGATFVTVAPWKDGALAMYIDARAALTPVHARSVVLAGQDRIELGPDAVIFVGEGAESRMSGALATGSGGPAFALLPAAKDLSQFGMAAIRIDDAPKDDMPVVWSSYPNGLSPAPIAATRGVSPIHVARARPEGRALRSPHVLEIGVLAADGQFQARCEAAQGASFKHVALEADRDGSLWLAYTNDSGTWIEQRAAGP